MQFLMYFFGSDIVNGCIKNIYFTIYFSVGFEKFKLAFYSKIDFIE